MCWSVQHVLSWLERVGLGECAPAFNKYKVDGVALLLLPDTGFDECKLPKSKRKQVLSAVQSLISERTRFFPAYKSMSLSLSLSLSLSGLSLGLSLSLSVLFDGR